jgi:hypothetical protein
MLRVGFEPTTTVFSLAKIIHALGRAGSCDRQVATCTQNKRSQTSMPQVGFEPTNPVFKRAKTSHSLERADPYERLRGNKLKEL